MPEALLFVLVRQLNELSQTERISLDPQHADQQRGSSAWSTASCTRWFTARGTRLLLLPGLAL